VADGAGALLLLSGMAPASFVMAALKKELLPLDGGGARAAAVAGWLVEIAMRGPLLVPVPPGTALGAAPAGRAADRAAGAGADRPGLADDGDDARVVPEAAAGCVPLVGERSIV
jgi:hypothetical protein